MDVRNIAEDFHAELKVVQGKAPQFVFNETFLCTQQQKERSKDKGKSFLLNSRLALNNLC